MILCGYDPVTSLNLQTEKRLKKEMMKKEEMETYSIRASAAVIDNSEEDVVPETSDGTNNNSTTKSKNNNFASPTPTKTMIRVVALDIDGTLCRSDGTIDDETIRVLHNFVSSSSNDNNKCVIATGRNLPFATNIAKTLERGGVRVDALVVSDGGLVVGRRNNKNNNYYNKNTTTSNNNNNNNNIDADEENDICWDEEYHYTMPANVKVLQARWN